MATEIGRSMPGLHAGDILRAADFIKSLPGVSRVAATAVFDQLHTAALHASLFRGGAPLGAMILIEPLPNFARWAARATTRGQSRLKEDRVIY